MTPLWIVFVGALATCLATGLGVLPLWRRSKVSDRFLGMGEALAGGLMLAASFVMAREGIHRGAWTLVLGVCVGILFVEIVARRLHADEDNLVVGMLRGADARRALLVVGVMFAHSFAEGAGIGVSYGGGEHLGLFITIALAIHNIPEGLAIALVLVPRGVSLFRASGWAIFSSIPQPIVAIPAYLLVVHFAHALPIGLGFASGAMIWLCVRELLPSALTQTKWYETAASVVAGFVVMFCLQTLI